MPVATAGWGDLVGLLVFLIVSGWINYSRRKKAEEEAQGTPSPRTDRPAPQGGTAAQDRRPAPAVYGGEDEDEEEWDGGRDIEHSERWNDHEVRETRSTEARSPEALAGEDRIAENRLESRYGGGRAGARGGSPANARMPESQRSLPGDRVGGRDGAAAKDAADKAREKAAEMGKDLLTKLAKELGIELPAPAPKPAPRPSPPPPPPAPEGRVPSRIPGASPRAGSAGPDEARAKAAEEARTRSLQAAHRTAIPAPQPMGGTPPRLVAGDLANPEALRKAFILKTILDRPVSMRPPSGPGPGPGPSAP